MAADTSDTQPAKLRTAIETMDMYSQMAFDDIEALSALARRTIAQLVDELPVGPTRSQLITLSRAIGIVHNIAADAQNNINSTAEDVGCNFKEPGHG